MTPEPEQAPEPESTHLGPFARITGVFFEPGKTFEDIGRKPNWLPPVLVLIVATFAVTWVMSHRIGMEQIIRQQMESNPRMAQMPADQREQAIAMQSRVGGIFAYLVPLFLPVGYLIVSGVMLAVTSMMSAGLKFKQVFAAVCYANLPGIFSATLLIVVMYLKNPTEFNVQNPLAFNPAAFLDPAATSKFIYSLSSSLDLFSFWIIFLMATGLSAAAGRRLPFGKALFAVLLPWGLFIVCRAAIAGAFS